MTTPEREASCTFIWSPHVINLDELAVFTSLLADLHSELAAPYVASELVGPTEFELPTSPLVTSLRMGSPIISELTAGSPDEWLILALGVVGYILKHPDRLGSFWPKIKEGWYRGEERALEARLRFIEARGSLEARGRPIERYERAERDHSHRVSRTERETQDRSSPGDIERGGRDR